MAIWRVVIGQIDSPLLRQINFNYTLQKDGEDFFHGNVQYAPSEFSNMTTQQKIAKVKADIVTECTEAVEAHQNIAALLSFQGQTFDPTA